MIEELTEAKGVNPMNIPNTKNVKKWNRDLRQTVTFVFDLFSGEGKSDDSNPTEDG